MGATIELSGVSKLYGAVEALAPTSITFEAGDTAVLIGPSGCGKSTLLRLIVGLVQPDSGKVRVFGQDLQDRNLLQVRRKIGYVIQDGGLFPHLTALENISLLARHLGQTKARIDGRARELCELTHFPPDALGRYPVELSGGQRQRVGLMRGLFLDPEILLLDEPLGALDAIVRAALQVELKSIFETLRKTVVLVTHDLAEAAFLADRIVLMRAGKIVQDGSYEDLRSSPADGFVAEFLSAQRGLVAL